MIVVKFSKTVDSKMISLFLLFIMII